MENNAGFGALRMTVRKSSIALHLVVYVARFRKPLSLQGVKFGKSGETEVEGLSGIPALSVR